MVVTRKKPVAPTAPPASRTSSSQTLARKPQSQRLANQTDKMFDTSNGFNPEPPEIKSPPRQPRKRRSLLDIFFFPSLFAFLLYTLLTCPQQFPPTSPVCRGLAQYKHAVLEPYVLPVLTHPIIATPYKTHVRPRIHAVRTYTAPIARLEHRVRPHVLAATHKVYSSLHSLYHATLRTYWDRAVVPRYNLYLAPHINPYLSALSSFSARVLETTQQYWTLACEKTAHMSPYVRVVAAYMRTLRVYLLRAWASAKPFLVRVYVYVYQLWTAARPHVYEGLRYSQVLAAKGVSQLGVHRRTYVDPHVKRIWAKVVESSSSSSLSPSPSSPSSPSSLSPSPSSSSSLLSPSSSSSTTTTTVLTRNTPTTDEGILEFAVPVPVPTPSSVVDATPEVVDATPEVVDATAGSTQDATTESTQDGTTESTQDATTESTPDATIEEAEIAVSRAEQSAGHASGVVADLEREVYALTEESGPESTETPPPTEGSVPAHTEENVPPPTEETVPETDQVEEEEDMDTADFLRDLGIDEDSPSQSSNPSSSSPDPSSSQDPQTPLTPSERLAHAQAAKSAAAALTLKKRTAIVARHVRWQAELDSLVKEQERRVLLGLGEVREGAVREVGEVFGGGGGEGDKDGKKDKEGKKDKDGKKDKNKKPKGVVAKVENEAEKLMKGLEGYLRKAEGRVGGQDSANTAEHTDSSSNETPSKEPPSKETLEREEAQWRRVVDKVEVRFGDVVRDVQGEVHAWYMGVREREGQVVLNLATEVKNLAERAQADLGLDYAWLDDVTYNDWQKYHDLVRTYEKFDATARALQNGTSPDAPADPIIPALDKLQLELDEVVAGFGVRLGLVDGRAGEVFGVYYEDEEVEGEGVDGEGEVVEGEGVDGEEDGEGEEDEYAGMFEYEGVEMEPEGSVLPVDSTLSILPADPTVSILPVDPTVSILPIDPIPTPGGVMDPANVIMGKSKEQVEAALKGVSVEPSQSESEDGETERRPKEGVHVVQQHEEL